MISLQNVTVNFNSQVVLDNVSLKINQGEFVFLVGQTGCGKTTLLRLIYMDLFPTRGSIAVDKYRSDSISVRDIPYLRRKIGVVFQDFKLLEDRNVFDNVAFALHVTNARRADIKRRVLRILADVGLSHKRNRMPYELAGGEQQRASIARALVNEPFVLLADEPTGNLDPATALEILQLLQEINTRGTAVLVGTHNYDLVRKSHERIMQIKNGKLFEVEVKR
ncbi:MAG: cell division ATP-binding protein FtsE [Bacteroidota bacterium]